MVVTADRQVQKSVVVLQSNYLPWRGYFSLIASSHECIIYDSRQFTKNDWRNRNRLRFAEGFRWLTIPVHTAGRFGQAIYDVEISDTGWGTRHVAIIDQLLGAAPYFAVVRNELLPVLERCSSLATLHEVNLALMRACADLAGIATRFSLDSEYDVSGDSPTARVAGLVQQAGGSRYVTGPAGLSYLDLAEFSSRGIAVDVIDYGSLEPYPQQFDGFEAGVSVIDYFANVSPADYRFVASTRPAAGVR